MDIVSSRKLYVIHPF